MKEVRVHGISMEPILHEGDIVLVETVDRYKIGDILVFNYGKQGMLIHRLINQIGELFVCQGDNAVRKEIVGKRRILGRTVMTHEGMPYKVKTVIEE